MSLSEARGREIVYERSQRRCEVCQRPADSVHHRMKQGRPWDPANLLSLCGDGTRFCHGWIEAHPQDAMLLGLWLPRGVDYHLYPAYLHPTMWWRAWWLPDDTGCWTYADHPPDDHPDTPARLRAIQRLTDDRQIHTPVR